MSLFSSLQNAEPNLSDADIAQALEQVKSHARVNRLIVVAPFLFVAAIVGAFIAAPPSYGGLLVTEAQASDQPRLPRVFGSGGVWNFAEPIADEPVVESGPASMVQAPVGALEPSYVLVPPTDFLQSFPVSVPTPPSLTPEQSADLADLTASASTEVDWSKFTPVIRVEPPVVAPVPAVQAPVATEPATDSISTDSIQTDSIQTDSIEVDAVDLDGPLTATPSTSSSDASQAVVGGIPVEVFPSLPPQGSSFDSSVPASVLPVSVLVHNARMTVRVQVVDEDSSFIDPCNTRIAWGDGSESGMVTAGDSASCDSTCTVQTGDSTGINAELLFEHEYAGALDAEPRVFVATGDGCSYQLAELGLQRIAIVPW